MATGGRSIAERPPFFYAVCANKRLAAFSRLAIFQGLMISRLIRMANGGDEDGLDDIETGVATRTRPIIKKPSNYKVLMLNDDYTPMEFVVLVLQRFFSMGIEDATRVMLQVHQQGVAICGVFTYEVAETKVTQVHRLCAREPAPVAVHA